MDQSIAQIIQDRAAANGVDPAVLAQIATVESGGDPNAAATGSSARGLFQFTGPTWKQYGNGADPLDPTANADAGARLLKDNSTALAGSGIEASPANAYLAHFAGIGGAKKVLTADPAAPVASVLGDDAVSANPFLKNMTVADLQGWAAKKMATSPASQPARPGAGILNQAGATPSSGPGLLNGASAEPDDSAALQLAFAKATQQPQEVSAASLPPIKFIAPHGYDRARFLAALTARKIA